MAWPTAGARADHAPAAPGWRFSMQEAAARVARRTEAVSLRIGLNSGPVVCGVIGAKKFAYDLWSTRSTRRPHGIPRHPRPPRFPPIPISFAHSFVFEERGEVDIKGRNDAHLLLVGRESSRA